MADQFYVGRGGKSCGPFSAAQLKRIAADGRLLRTDTIWWAGMEEPVLASRVKDLFPPLQRPAPAAEAVEPAPTPVQAAPADPPAKVIVVPIDPSAAALPPAADATALGLQSEPPAPEKPSAGQPEPVKKRRAVGVKGAIILSQDGVSVQYRKKCSQCGHEDASRSTMLIGNGTSRASFYCKKCRKNREVEIRGMTQ